MKVFLSWSGTQSHKVALVFRDWLPSVIQDIEPYVSSEDIDKGARWSTDIAKELSDSKFGILCVTKDNLDAPWLMFEAGALSKTMEKTFVSPFLFDIKRSEVDGPILQFQSTIFDKDDLKKLIVTLNNACNDRGLATERLNEAFDVWFPILNDKLIELRGNIPEQDTEGTTEHSLPMPAKILEEILELSRINQKLIRSSEGELEANLNEITQLLHRHLVSREDVMSTRRKRELHPRMLDELMHMPLSVDNSYVGIQMILGILKDSHPWIYDTGIETINILRSRRSISEKKEALNQFDHIVMMSNDHPIAQEIFGSSREMHYFFRILPGRLNDIFEKIRNSEKN